MFAVSENSRGAQLGGTESVRSGSERAGDGRGYSTNQNKRLCKENHNPQQVLRDDDVTVTPSQTSRVYHLELDGTGIDRA